jgi:hypothetical protein
MSFSCQPESPLSISESQDRIDPKTIYVVREGPLKGGFVTILAVEEGGRRVRALVSRGNLLTPPIMLDTSLLRKMRSTGSHLPWWAQTCACGLGISLFVAFELRWPMALIVAAACLAVCAGHFLWCGISSRRVRTCPCCGARLDPETWSHCQRCEWERPMPYFLPPEMRAPAAADNTMQIPSEPREQPPKLRWYVKVYVVQQGLLVAASLVGFLLLPLRILPEPWQRWTLKAIVAVVGAGIIWTGAPIAWAVVHDQATQKTPRDGRGELWIKSGFAILMGAAAATIPFCPLPPRLELGVGSALLLDLFGCYLMLMGACGLLWAANGAEMPKREPQPPAEEERISED